MYPIPTNLPHILLTIWDGETSQDPNWSADNPALGQCAATSGALFDLFGLPLSRCWAITPEGERISHYCNGKDDYTESQFPDGTVLELRNGPQGPDARAYLAENADTEARIDLVKARLLAHISQ
jgi:hypothetical protein